MQDLRGYRGRRSATEHAVPAAVFFSFAHFFSAAGQFFFLLLKLPKPTAVTPPSNTTATSNFFIKEFSGLFSNETKDTDFSGIPCEDPVNAVLNPKGLTGDSAAGADVFYSHKVHNSVFLLHVPFRYICLNRPIPPDWEVFYGWEAGLRHPVSARYRLDNPEKPGARRKAPFLKWQKQKKQQPKSLPKTTCSTTMRTVSNRSTGRSISGSGRGCISVNWAMALRPMTGSMCL